MVPARNEAAYIGDCLDSLAALDTDRARGLVAASSRCRMLGLRASLVTATINHLFRRLSAYGDVAYYPDALVETSGRRVRESGLTGTLYHYVKLDVGRIRTRTAP